MYQEVRALIRWRWEVLRRASAWPEAIAYVILPLAAVVVFVVGWAITDHVQDLGAIVLWVGTALAFTVLQAIILGTSIARVLTSMYLDSDLELLLVAPVHPAAVFIARLLEVLAFPGLFLSAIVLFGLWGVGVGLGVGLLFYPVSLLSVLLLPLLPTAAAALFTMAMVRYLPAWRLREILAVTGSLLWVAYYALQNTLWRTMSNSLWPMFLMWLAGGKHTGFFATSPGPVPANWAAWATVAVALGRPGRAAVPLLGFAALSLLAFVVIVVAAERLYMSGWANVGVVQRRRRRARPRAVREVTWLPRRVWAIMWKDWLLVRRDLRRLVQLLWPLVYIFAVFGGASRGSKGMATAMAAVRVDVLWLGLVLGIGFMLAFMVAAFGGTALANEGNTLWLLRSAPVSAWEWLMAKFWAGFLPAFAWTVVYLVVAYLIGWWGLGGLARGIGVALIEGIGITAVSLSIVESPQEAADPSSGGAEGLYRFLYMFGYLVVADLILILPTWQSGVMHGTVAILPVAGVIVWTVMAAGLSLQSAATALERMEA